MIKERLKTFISYLNMGQARFERECGLANGYVNNIRQSITPEKLQKIALRYPELNTGWLMTGEGDMLRSPQESMDYESPEPIKLNTDTALIKALESIQIQQRITAKSQEQIDRLIGIIEKINLK